MRNRRFTDIPTTTRSLPRPCEPEQAIRPLNSKLRMINNIRHPIWQSTFAAAIALSISLLPGSIAVAALLLAQATPEIAPLPPELPLPASSPSQENWLHEANVLQPYGHSAFVALTKELATRPAHLKKEFGFNAIIVQPPDSHNTIAAPADKLNEKQFVDGLAAYRAAGYRIMLYTSVMALGMSTENQSGQIAREHPDWQQRDPKGNPILVYGVPWLCPSTGARESALDRCLQIAHRYNADAILLDNNQFFFTAAGWTCHCDACTKAFREYVEKRFGDEKSVQLFGIAPKELKIPTEEGPLYFEWLHWRNRVWADINESFRARLRKQNPNIILFANTQYLYDNGVLATDQQYAREDIVVSESCDLTSYQMSAKMVLGHGLAAGRPLWNYIGTFVKGDDYTGLRPPVTIGPAIAATLAHHALPWIVDGFDEGPTDVQSCALMSKLLAWHATHQDLFAGQPYSPVATIISTESRNVRHTHLPPPHVTGLQHIGIPVIAVRDEALTLDQLRPFRVLTIENGQCLPAEAAAAIATWVRKGGTLVTDTEVATYDEIGRKLPASLLWQALGLDRPPIEPRDVGRGKAIAAHVLEGTAIHYAKPYSFLEKPSGIHEVVAYQTENSLLLHLIRHEKANASVSLLLHKRFPPNTQAQLYIPGSDRPQPLPVITTADGATVTVPNAPLYCVVEIPLTTDN